MSRETDSSSSGPQGRGGAAYPSGTPPYGTRQYPSLHPTQDAGRDDAAANDGEARKPEEPRTETTLTTRIRINIPGSRPIPPVVVRKPVEDGDSDPAAAGPTSSVTGTSPTPPAGLPALAPRSETPAPRPGGSAEGREEAKTSDWFAPRKPPSATPPVPAEPTPPPSGERQRSDLPYFSGGSGTGAGAPGAGPGPGAGQGPGQGPGHGPGQVPRPGDTGSTPVYGADGSGPYGGGRSGDSGTGPLPVYGSGSAGAPPSGGPPGRPGHPGSAGPAGPTSGPMTGDMPLLPPGFQHPPGQGASDDTARLTRQTPALGDTGQLPPAPGIGAVGPGPGGPGPGVPGTAAPGPGVAGPGNGQVPGGQEGPGGPGGEGGPRGPERISGDTLVSGIPRVPSSNEFPFPGSPAAPFPGSPAAPFPGSPAAGERAFPSGPSAPDGHDSPAPAPVDVPSAPLSAPAKKGRSKLVLAGAGLAGLAVVAYGAGLVLDHADVPNGTTVLGVDIGGMTKEDAVAKLDGALGDRINGPMTVTIDGKERQLKPSAAGLALDTRKTVRDVAGRDYNPVSVIGSLFGGAREGTPAIEIDEEKLAAALKTLSGQAAGSQDGTIKFVPGKAVAVPGKTHKALDVNQAVDAVEEAYRERAETGRNAALALPVSMQKPSISKAEIDRKMKEFAEPAMSDLVTIKAGGKSIPFGPDKSLPKILSVKPVNGRLVEVYDRAALKKLYGSTFEGVLITKGDGSKKPVSPEDVAAALAKALRGKTPEERIGVIPLDPG
ncbi:hypothetical protein [Streptomyces sp. NPDC051776]|uniref:hypothetical protein n=1 Tax=Streptomyces sp. NPDC051776 TaxID=3155414 RepID=UPI00343A94DE